MLPQQSIAKACPRAVERGESRNGIRAQQRCSKPPYHQRAGGRDFPGDDADPDPGSGRCLRRRLWPRGMGFPDDSRAARPTGLTVPALTGQSKMFSSPSQKPSAGEPSVSVSRRAFLRGTVRPSRQEPKPVRPPWTDQDRVAALCTGCGDCLRACPEEVLVPDADGFPVLDPRLGTGACSFCGACAEACPVSVFDVARIPPWSVTVVLDPGLCLAHAGVHCESCRDNCEAGAISFAPRIGGPPRPEVHPDRCTGCGACVGGCPGAALDLKSMPAGEQAA